MVQASYRQEYGAFQTPAWLCLWRACRAGNGPEPRPSPDVRRIREHPLVSGRIPIDGFIYQVETGELIEIAEASAVGEVR